MTAPAKEWEHMSNVVRLSSREKCRGCGVRGARWSKPGRASCTLCDRCATREGWIREVRK